MAGKQVSGRSGHRRAAPVPLRARHRIGVHIGWLTVQHHLTCRPKSEPPVERHQLGRAEQRYEMASSQLRQQPLEHGRGHPAASMLGMDDHVLEVGAQMRIDDGAGEPDQLARVPSAHRRCRGQDCTDLCNAPLRPPVLEIVQPPHRCCRYLALAVGAYRIVARCGAAPHRHYVYDTRIDILSSRCTAVPCCCGWRRAGSGGGWRAVAAVAQRPLIGIEGRG